MGTTASYESRSTGLEVRILQHRDAEALWHIRLEALQREPHAFSESAAEHQVRSIEEVAARMSATAESFGLGAFCEGRLIGILRFERAQREKNRHRASLHSVYVTPEYRGRGIARALLTEVLRLARAQQGLEQIELAVGTEQLAAKRLYESFGFSCCGREQHALKMGDQYVDYDLLILRL
ncbi:MAG TPA: GNAT family N-acetyltransferase [Candidatus Sulfotelmatobacter sp.]|nr:GNAT family N-acetyltransferase [Terriglobales bacterium]HKT88763.1 GNAT family N-acetyltransferase [Candidatus Sulfotelmatobacter sp.]